MDTPEAINNGQTAHEGFSKPRKVFSRAAEAVSTSNIFVFLLGFRIVNALSIKTFFQPDEYFQSLEPAWQIAFGEKSGAWITWVCGSLLAVVGLC